MRVIVLDSNAFFGHFRLTGTAFLLFLDGIQRTADDLYVPEVVLDEVVNKYHEEIIRHYEDTRTALRKLGRLLGRELESTLGHVELEQERENYREFLVEELKRVGAKFIPYPNTPHSEIVARDLARKKPFKESGSGYRDCLLWESVLSILETKNLSVVFVTGNRKDFGDGPQVHEHLLQDLDKRAINHDRVQLHLSLGALNGQLIIPQLRILYDMFEKFAKDEVDGFSLHTWIKSTLLDYLRDVKVGRITTGIDDEDCNIGIEDLWWVKSWSIDDVRELRSGDIMLSASTELDANVRVIANWEQYCSSFEVHEYFGDSERFEGIINEEAIEISVKFTLILEKGTRRVLDCQIDQIEGDYGSVELHPHPQRPA